MFPARWGIIRKGNIEDPMTTDQIDTRIEQLLYVQRRLPASTEMEVCNAIADEINLLRIERVKAEQNQAA